MIVNISYCRESYRALHELTTVWHIIIITVGNLIELFTRSLLLIWVCCIRSILYCSICSLGLLVCQLSAFRNYNITQSRFNTVTMMMMRQFYRALNELATVWRIIIITVENPIELFGRSLLLIWYRSILVQYILLNWFNAVTMMMWRDADHQSWFHGWFSFVSSDACQAWHG